MFVVTVYASPFVVSNVYAPTGIQPDYFSVVLDVAPAQNSTPQSVAGGVRLHYDLAGVSNGAHTLKIRPCSALWGCAAEFPFSFTKGVPPNITSVVIEQ